MIEKINKNFESDLAVLAGSTENKIKVFNFLITRIIKKPDSFKKFFDDEKFLKFFDFATIDIGELYTQIFNSYQDLENHPNFAKFMDNFCCTVETLDELESEMRNLYLTERQTIKTLLQFTKKLHDNIKNLIKIFNLNSF